MDKWANLLAKLSCFHDILFINYQYHQPFFAYYNLICNTSSCCFFQNFFIGLHWNIFLAVTSFSSMQALFDRARQDPSDLDEARVLVVTHGGLIRETLSIFAGRLGCTFPKHLGQSLHQVINHHQGSSIHFSDLDSILDINWQF